MTLVTFSYNLRSARRNAGYTQEMLAKKLGMTRQNYSRYESDSLNAQPSLELLCELSRVLKTTPNDLIGYQPVESGIINESASLMILYAVRYALSSNGDAIAPGVINFAKSTLPYLNKRILFDMEKDILFNYDSNSNIGATAFYDKEWTDFALAIRKEREKRGSKE